MLETLMEIDVRKIHTSKLNPRKEVDVESLKTLSASIKEVGLLQPIVVRPLNNEFEVVVGERRYRASQEAGLDKIPAIVREYSDDEVVRLNLIENVQREELSAIEKGKVCKYLLENHSEKYPSQSSIAAKIGVSSETVSLWLQSIEIVPEEAQKYVSPSKAGRLMPEGKIDYQTAIKVGRSVEEPERKVELIRKLAEKGLPTKERNEIIKRTANEPEKPIQNVFDEVQESLCQMQFASGDKKSLLDGTKTQVSLTSIPDPKIKAGTIVHASIWEPRVAELRIQSVERKRLKYFDESDAKREGGFTLSQFRKIWADDHGDWDENQLVYVIRFEKLK